MNTDPDRPHVVTQVATEFEAASIVSALQAAGIKAMAVGDHVAGFRVEAPGDVSVVVPESEAGRAAEVLAEFGKS